MKIKLRNDGGYGDMENVIFPAEVEGRDWLGFGFDILGSEIVRVGGKPGEWKPDEYYYWSNDEVQQ